MSNPFFKQPILDAKEYLKNKSNISKFRSLKMKRKNYLNTGIICNNKLSHINGQSNLLNFTKGYFLTKDDCFDKRSKTHDITDGRYSYIDFDDIEIQKDYSKDCLCLEIESYKFDPCRLKKGLTAPAGKLCPTYKTRPLNLHTTNSMIIYPDDCNIKFKNNVKLPLIHNNFYKITHAHYFPTNRADISYTHRHGFLCPKDHDCYKHPAKKTNHYYIAKNYSSNYLLGFKKDINKKRISYPPPKNEGYPGGKCCDVPPIPKNKNVVYKKYSRDKCCNKPYTQHHSKHNSEKVEK